MENLVLGIPSTGWALYHFDLSSQEHIWKIVIT